MPATYRILILGASYGSLLATKLLLGATGALLTLLMVMSSPALWRVLVGIVMTAFGWFLPDILLYNAAEHRRIDIRRALPDTLDQMTISVEAGLAFDAAMARAGRSGDGRTRPAIHSDAARER